MDSAEPNVTNRLKGSQNTGRAVFGEFRRTLMRLRARTAGGPV